MYLLFQAGGYPAQAALWQMQKTGRFVLYDLQGDAVDRLATLMEKYQDRPMDRADASLIVAAERLGIRRIVTLDSAFSIDRLADGSTLLCGP